jgi:predicted ATPase/class 3 adenylate cyclase
VERNTVLGGRERKVEPPRGIVTFVFTDIEGSTRLFRRLGERYADLLTRHGMLLRRAWAGCGGYEAGTEGDSFFVAFGAAHQAIRACIDAQRFLAEESWPHDDALRVRMGMHTGLASPQDGGYVALAVHKAARVMSAAHGGQILLTQETVEALGDADRPRLRRLGRFRLRGFDEPARLHQVVSSGLQEGFPAVRAVPADGHNIVRPATATVGRDRLIAELVAELAPRRLITIVGTGGVGKTRVATEVSMRAAPAWDDGVWMVDLAGVTEPSLVAAAVADAIGASSHAGGDRWDDALDHLEPKRAVIVLDDCEHVAAECRRLVSSLFATCGGVGVLATSREPLRAPGEALRHIDPLAVPPEPSSDLAAVRESPAGLLFATRGAAVRPGFAVTEGNAADVAEICRTLDGLPLLIELAAAHLSAQSPAEILAGLEDRLRTLRNPDPVTPERHRSVEGLLDWSYRLLDGAQQAALRRLSIFGAGFSTATATAAVATGDLDAAAVPELLWLLVDRSLVVADLAANETRYRLLQSVRAYARSLLDEHGETAVTAVGLSTAMLQRVGPWHQPDPRWVGEVGMELDNLRALVPVIPEDHQELAQQLACSIGLYHDARQSFREGIGELTRYGRALRQGTATRVSLLTTLAYLHLRTGDADNADELVAAAGELERVHASPSWDDVATDRTRGEIARRRGDLAGAVRIARSALERPLSDWGRARMYNLLGTTLAALGDLEASFAACEADLKVSRAIGNDSYVASAEGNLAEVAMRLGDIASAAAHQRACLELAVALGSPAMLAFSLIMAARIAGAREAWGTAVRLHARGEEILHRTGLSLYEDDRRESDRLLEQARRELADGFAASCASGRDLEVTDAVELAASVLEEAERVT